MNEIRKIVQAHAEQATPYRGDRHLIASAQIILKAEGVDPGPVDGYLGPMTECAVMDYLNQTIDREDTNPNGFPVYEHAHIFYGDPGDNLTTIDAPYPLKLSWNTDQVVNRITCNEKVADSLTRVLKMVKVAYGEKITAYGLDLFGGCYSKRKMRGGTKWSTHAYGVALDFDPANNRLRWTDKKAHFARSEYDEWWKIWEDEGWVSLGREKNYDWMHVQAIRL